MILPAFATRRGGGESWRPVGRTQVALVTAVRAKYEDIRLHVSLIFCDFFFRQPSPFLASNFNFLATYRTFMF
jgi:hypothetical protein